MSALAPRSCRTATAALAREPGEAADLAPVHRALRLAEIASRRATAAILEAEALTVAMIRAAREGPAEDAEGRAATHSPAPNTRVSTKTHDNDATKPDGRSAQIRNAGNTHPVAGEVPCAS